MSTWTAELINLLFHLIPKRHRYDIRSSYQWHRVPWYAGRNSANPRWRARKPRLVHAGFVAEPKNNQPHFFLFTSKFLTKMEDFPLIHLWVGKYTKFLIAGQELRSVVMDRTNCTLTFELIPCQTLTQILDEMTWAEPDDNIIKGVIECKKVGFNWRFVINTKIIKCQLY